MKKCSRRSSCVSAFRNFLLCAMALFISSAVSLRAQEGGTILGTVADSSGAVIADAQVTVTNQNTGAVVRTTASNASGNYIFAGLSPSTYTVRVQKQGFSTAVH